MYIVKVPDLKSHWDVDLEWAHNLYFLINVIFILIV